MNRRFYFRFGLLLLALFHGVVLCAGFFAPYDFSAQNREAPFARPTQVLFWVARGHFHLRPFVYRCLDGSASCETERSQACPIRFLASTVPDRLGGNSSWHFFRVDSPGQMFLMGTDSLGRDQFSRFLYGGGINPLGGWVAASLSLVLGAFIGSIA